MPHVPDDHQPKRIVGIAHPLGQIVAAALVVDVLLPGALGFRTRRRRRSNCLSFQPETTPRYGTRSDQASLWSSGAIRKNRLGFSTIQLTFDGHGWRSAGNRSVA